MNFSVIWIEDDFRLHNHASLEWGGCFCKLHRAAFTERIGLMGSAPEVHCTEGRDWKQILKSLSGETRPLNRSHLPAYNEVAARKYALHFRRHSRLSAAMVDEKVELWPELDNLPHPAFTCPAPYDTMFDWEKIQLDETYYEYD